MSTALVTGASSGLGREIAVLLAARGEHVTAVARSKDALDELSASSSRITGVAADLSTEEGRQRLFATIGTEVDILVNNAGLGASGAFAEMQPGMAVQLVR